MDKEVITSADISTLIGASNKLKPGNIIVATLQTNIIEQKTGTPKVVKSIIPESQYETKIIDLVAPIQGEGIKGAAIIDAFKNAQASTNKKTPFSLKKSFFTVFDKIVEKANNIKLNSGRIIYNYDEFGRVYIICDNRRMYLNKERTHCITEDGHYASIKISEDGDVELEYYDDEEAIYDLGFINFSYLYISPGNIKKSEQLINAEEERLFNRFIEESMEPTINPDPEIDLPIDTSSKIIDLEAYRQKLEEGPKR